MTTYTNPYTFCFIVCELLAQRGWKINKTAGRYVPYTLTIPGGISVEASSLAEAFVTMCEQFVAEHKLPIKFDRGAYMERHGVKHETTELDPNHPDSIFSGGAFHHFTNSPEMADILRSAFRGFPKGPGAGGTNTGF